MDQEKIEEEVTIEASSSAVEAAISAAESAKEAEQAVSETRVVGEDILQAVGEAVRNLSTQIDERFIALDNVLSDVDARLSNLEKPPHETDEPKKQEGDNSENAIGEAEEIETNIEPETENPPIRKRKYRRL
jgi:hypothetical protein